MHEYYVDYGVAVAGIIQGPQHLLGRESDATPLFTIQEFVPSHGPHFASFYRTSAISSRFLAS